MNYKETMSKVFAQNKLNRLIFKLTKNFNCL